MGNFQRHPETDMESEESKGKTGCGFEGRQSLQGEWGAKKDVLKTRFTKGESNAEALGSMALQKWFTMKQPGFTHLPFMSVLFLALNCDTFLYPSWSLLNSERPQRKN